MTREQFKELLIRLNPNNQSVVVSGAYPSSNLPMVATMTAAYCFVHDVDLNTPELIRDMQGLRDQLQSLETKGHFNFEGE